MTFRISVVFGLIAVALLSACTETKSTRFYLLSALPSPKMEKPGTTRENTVALAVGPIELPKHVNRSQIVTFSSANKIELGEFDRWAEPLADNFSRVLGDNLAVLIPTEQIVVHPWRQVTPFDYQITVEVSTFAVRPDGDVALIARWSLLSKKGTQMIMSRRSSFSEDVRGGGFEATVAAMSRTVADLSQDIATAIKSLPTGK